MVVKLLLPGQEDVGHLLLALPAAKERDGTVRAQPCNQHSTGVTSLSGDPSTTLVTVVLLWANDLTPLSQPPHLSNGHTISLGGVFNCPPIS